MPQLLGRQVGKAEAAGKALVAGKMGFAGNAGLDAVRPKEPTLLVAPKEAPKAGAGAGGAPAFGAGASAGGATGLGVGDSL